MGTNCLVADSGATKTSWRMLGPDGEKEIYTPGISPFFFDKDQIAQLITEQVIPKLDGQEPAAIYFYGTGCADAANKQLVKSGIEQAFGGERIIEVESDLLGAARALCGREPGVAAILGTGSNSCVFSGTEITKNNPAPGFILGDEGSGAYLGKKVLQYFIYQTFDEELMHKFRLQYGLEYRAILNKVYKEPWPNRFLASFAPFLAQNRGHYMIENIIEDGISDFIITHLYKYNETWTLPIHFTGGIAWHFKDMVRELCESFELHLGKILPEPMAGLIEYHRIKSD